MKMFFRIIVGLISFLGAGIVLPILGVWVRNTAFVVQGVSFTWLFLACAAFAVYVFAKVKF